MATRIEKNQGGGADIVIDGFEKGIADSPYEGISDMRNVNIISVPGEASVNFKSQSIAQVPISALNYSADTAGTFTYSNASPVKNGTKITLNSVTGGTASLTGITLTGNTTNIITQTGTTTTGSARFTVSSNALAGTSAIITIGFTSNPSNGDVGTIYVNGQSFTFNFVTTLGSTPGNILIGASLAATIYNLLYSFNNPTVTNTNQVAYGITAQTVLGYFTKAQVGIAFDTSSTGSAAAGSVTFNSGTTGTLVNGMGIVVANNNTIASLSATWGGVAMTKISENDFTSVFLYLSPPSGVKSIVVSGGGGQIAAVAATYSGVAQTTTVDNSAGSVRTVGTGTVTQALTEVADHCWSFLALTSLAVYSASTGTTERNKVSSPGGNLAFLGDSGSAISPIASYSMSATKDGGGTSQTGWLMFTLAPAVASTTVTVGLTTTGNYWVQNATDTTFTLTTQAPNGKAVFVNTPPPVPASATGTFTTLDVALLTQIVPYTDNTIYYGIDTNGRIWAYNTAVATNWVYLMNTATAATTPDFNNGIAIWQGYIFAMYDGAAGYYSYVRPVVDYSNTTFTASVTAADDLVTPTGTTASLGITYSTPCTFTGTTGGGLTNGTTYYAGVITSTQFQLFTDIALTTPLNITADGSGKTFTYFSSNIARNGAFYPFKTLTNGAYLHRTFVDTSNTLYWCDGSNFASMILVPTKTFNPVDSVTYTYSSSVFSTPAFANFTCIEQLGVNLVIGTDKNYFVIWDRFSTGFNPVFIPEINIHRLVSLNSNTFIFAGNRGRIFVTNGANAQLFKKFPDHLSGTIEPTFAWGGATYNKNQLYFAISTFGSSTTTETGIVSSGGIWAIDTDTKALRLVNKLSYDTYGGFCSELTPLISTATSTSGLQIQNFGLISGWENSTESASPSYGSDVLPVITTPTISNTPYTNYESYIDSDMIPIGTYLNPTTDANVEFKLTVPIVSGEGVKLAYRQKLSDSFTDITNGEFTTAGIYSGVVKVNFQKSQWLQIRCYTKSTATTPSYTRLRELRIR